MPPATDPVPVLVLNALLAKLALPDGLTDYYHDVTVATHAVGQDITEIQPVQYPAVFVGEPGEVGQYSEVADDHKTLWLGHWYWDIPVFGVISDVGMGDAAYRSLLKLAADIYRAVLTDYTLSGTCVRVEVRGWTILGPQEQTQNRPWVGVLVRAVFRTRDTEMVSAPV